MPAKVESLGKLHKRLTKVLLDILKNGQVVEILNEETGELEPKVVTPDKAYLNIARQFLKDNNIEADLSQSADGKELTEELPFDEDDAPDNVTPISKASNG